MLSGIRVIDLTTFIAGPACPRALADFGADVIKVEEPGEEPPLWYPNLHIETHRGKRHMVLDLKSPAGREAFKRLVRSSHVVVENAKSTVWPALGLGFDDLVAINPNLIYVSIKAYGSDGPWGAWGGFEPNAQAVTGMQVRFGGTGTPRQAGGGAINDYGAPQIAAAAVILALRSSRREQPTKVEAALAWSASLFQSSDLFRSADHEPQPLGGLDARGPSLNSRLWQCADGWIYAVMRGAVLTQAAERLGAAEAEEGALVEAFRTRQRSDAVNVVRAVGGAATNAAPKHELTERLNEEGKFAFDDQPAWGPVGRIGYSIDIEPPLANGWRPAPGWGQHTRIVLEELGYESSAIDQLFDEGVAR